jgi:hypothetical protein
LKPLDPIKALRTALLLIAGVAILHTSIAATAVRADLSCAAAADSTPKGDDCAKSGSDTSNVRPAGAGDLHDGSPKLDRAAPASAVPALWISGATPPSAPLARPAFQPRPVYLLTRRLRV